MIQTVLERRIVRPILDLLRQGITPEKIALSVAFALVLGVFPALGWTTLLCLIVALGLRLNVPAMQLVNYLAYPLQLMLLVPFIRGGEILFRAPRLSLSLPQILSMVHAGVWQAIKTLWVSTVHAIAVWSLLAPIAIYLVYKVLAPLLRSIAPSRQLANPEPESPVALEVC
jgi:uncharacterized protein (DUF2062 family)